MVARLNGHILKNLHVYIERTQNKSVKLTVSDEL